MRRPRTSPGASKPFAFLKFNPWLFIEETSQRSFHKLRAEQLEGVSFCTPKHGKESKPQVPLVTSVEIKTQGLVPQPENSTNFVSDAEFLAFWLVWRSAGEAMAICPTEQHLPGVARTACHAFLWITGLLSCLNFTLVMCVFFCIFFFRESAKFTSDLVCRKSFSSRVLKTSCLKNREMKRAVAPSNDGNLRCPDQTCGGLRLDKHESEIVHLAVSTNSLVDHFWNHVHSLSFL